MMAADGMATCAIGWANSFNETRAAFVPDTTRAVELGANTAPKDTSPGFPSLTGFRPEEGWSGLEFPLGSGVGIGVCPAAVKVPVFRAAR